jgi:hypothetical protein
MIPYSSALLLLALGTWYYLFPVENEKLTTEDLNWTLHIK